MVFKCIASVRTETLDSDGRHSLDDKLHSIIAESLASRCDEPTDDAPVQPPTPNGSRKKFSIKRSETQNGNLKGSGSADVSMEVPPKMSCSRSCSLPCEMDDTPVGFARCRSSVHSGVKGSSSCEMRNAFGTNLKVAPMQHEAHLPLPLQHEGMCREPVMVKAAQHSTKHMSEYSTASELMDSMDSWAHAKDCYAAMSRADSYCKSSFALDTNTLSYHDDLGLEMEKDMVSDDRGRHCSVMMWLPHRCINVLHLIRSGLTKLDNSIIHSSFKKEPKDDPKANMKGGQLDAPSKAKACAN